MENKLVKATIAAVRERRCKEYKLIVKLSRNNGPTASRPIVRFLRNSRKQRPKRLKWENAVAGFVFTIKTSTPGRYRILEVSAVGHYIQKIDHRISISGRKGPIKRNKTLRPIDISVIAIDVQQLRPLDNVNITGIPVPKTELQTETHYDTVPAKKYSITAQREDFSLVDHSHSNATVSSLQINVDNRNRPKRNQRQVLRKIGRAHV